MLSNLSLYNTRGKYINTVIKRSSAIINLADDFLYSSIIPAITKLVRLVGWQRDQLHNSRLDYKCNQNKVKFEWLRPTE